MQYDKAFNILKERGFAQQLTHETALAQAMAKGPITAYIGYDPTADSFHVGHLITLMAMKHLAAHGHRLVMLLGGATALIGDPTGKSEMRPVLQQQEVEKNTAALAHQAEKFLPKEAMILVNNRQWLEGLTYLHVLREVGRHFSVNRMLSAQMYKLRLETGLTFLEFNYQILQAYDFMHLCKTHNCHLQMGGDDQWSNILAGVELCRKMLNKEAFGFTFPLLTTADGLKMGKTQKGAIWLDPQRTSPYEYYQYWVNLADTDIVQALKFFTELPLAEINAIHHLEGADLNHVKNILAFETTQMLHGRQEAIAAQGAAYAAFGQRQLPEHILPSSTVPRRELSQLASIPSHVISFEQQSALSYVDLLLATGLAQSKNEARRLLQQNAVRLDDKKITLEDVLEKKDIQEAGSVLRSGKKNVVRLFLKS